MEPSVTVDAERARTELKRLVMQGSTSFAALSKMLGRNAAYLQQYVSRGSPKHLDENDRRALADFFGVDERLLGKGNGLPGIPTATVMISKMDVRASAGPGSAVTNERPVGSYIFDRQWLRNVGQQNADDLSIIKVSGDSMQPTLVDGDDILVRRISGSARASDGIFVLDRDNALIVKRLAVNPSSGLLTISSDNPAYPTWFECPLSTVRIIGQVVWVGRRLN